MEALRLFLKVPVSIRITKEASAFTNMKGLPGIGQQAVASSPLKAVIMIARTSGYTVPGLCSPSFVFVELHGVISTDSGGGLVIFTYIYIY